MAVNAAIIEKDFWVCWTLDYLFQDSPWKDQLAFKGGTSLSKSYNVIERFSEDIDLILDWRLLDYSAEEPWAERTNKKQDNFGKEAVARTGEFLKNKALPMIQPALRERAKAAIRLTAENENVIFHYPKAFSLDAVLPQIKLEFGPMA
ncbi:MAG TPA: nucleotidyl transferase AbiEii/AbiGii toxin family protein, partial [Anaerolineales bacterium]|nr:nucleotidyl transferase AbiEii/AbiGii toxin family protein [Anaerolineales bacterium]